MSELAIEKQTANGFANDNAAIDSSFSPLAESGLSVDPFEDIFRRVDITDIDYSNPDTHPDIPFFMGGDRRSVLDEITHLCQFSHNLVAVLGESGVGKTALAYQAAIELSNNADCCVMESSILNSTENMLLLLAQHIGVFVPDDANIDTIIGVLNEYQPSGLHQHVVLVIDEAHHLDQDALAAFIQLLQKPAPNYFHVLLLGNSTLLMQLDGLAKGGVLVYDIPLCPFSESELEHYLSFKLAQVGYQGAELFGYDSVQHIWRETKGIPARVHQVARNKLLGSNFNHDDEPRLGLPIGYMAIVVILLAALILAVFYIDDTDTPSDQAPSDSSSVSLEASSQAGETKDKSVLIQSDSESDSLQNDSVQDSTTLNLDQTQNAVSSSETSLPVMDAGAETSSFAVIDDTEVISAIVPKVEQPKTTEPVNDESDNTVDAQTAPSISVPPVVKPPVTAQPPKSIPVKPVSPLPRSLTSNESAVMSWPASGYTLQVMAAAQLASVNRFVNSQPNRALLRVVTLRRNSAPWHVVFAGVYETREEALASIRELPDSQKKAQPWPRRISDIQGKISEFRRK